MFTEDMAETKGMHHDWNLIGTQQKSQASVFFKKFFKFFCFCKRLLLILRYEAYEIKKDHVY